MSAFVCDCGRLRLPGTTCVCGRAAFLLVLCVLASLALTLEIVR